MIVLGLSIVRLILVLVSLLFIIDRVIRYFDKEKNQTLFKLFSTLLVWGTIIVVTVFNNFGVDTSLIFIGFIAVFIIIFRMLSIIENLERNITKIVRKEAIKGLKDGK